jgi:outer membrane protein assembly factor BamB
MLGFAQSTPPPIRPLLTPPVEKLTVNPGFRDWGPATIAGSTILAGNPTNRGGLFAVDTLSGKLKWSHRPGFKSGTDSVSTPPAVAAGIVVVSYAAANPGALIALSLATGKELWRGPDPVQDAAPIVGGGLAYILGKNGTFYSLDAATGRQRWTFVLSTKRTACVSSPILRDASIYLTGRADATPGDPAKPPDDYLFALDANTGQERWRYRAEAPGAFASMCLRQPIVTANTIFAAGGARLYAIQKPDRPWPSPAMSSTFRATPKISPASPRAAPSMPSTSTPAKSSGPSLAPPPNPTGPSAPSPPSTPESGSIPTKP